MKKIVLFLLFLSVLYNVKAYDQRDLLQHKSDIPALKSSLILNQKWVTYPGYTDRNGWDALTSGVKKDIIKKGEATLNYEWKVVKATDYLSLTRADRERSWKFRSIPIIPYWPTWF